MAIYDDMGVRIELLMRSRRQISHGNKARAWDRGQESLPRFANIKQTEFGTVCLDRDGLHFFLQNFRGDLIFHNEPAYIDSRPDDQWAL